MGQGILITSSDVARTSRPRRDVMRIKGPGGPRAAPARRTRARRPVRPPRSLDPPKSRPAGSLSGEAEIEGWQKKRR